LAASTAERIAVCADLHLSEKKSQMGGDVEGGVPLRLQDKLAGLRQWFSELNQRGIKTAAILGDIFDYPEASETLRRAFYATMEDYDGAVVLLLGNHDFRTGLNYNLSADAELLRRTGDSSVCVVDTCRILNGVEYIPWPAMLQTRQPVTQRIVLTHADMLGFKMNEHATQRSMSVFSAAEIGRAKLLVSGHYHERQMKQMGGVWFGYVGAMFRQNFGEGMNPTGWGIIDVDAATIDFVDTQDRMYTTLEWNTSSTTQDEFLARIRTKPEYLDGAFARVIVTGKAQNILSAKRNVVIDVLRAELAVAAVKFDVRIDSDVVVQDSQEVFRNRAADLGLRLEMFWKTENDEAVSPEVRELVARYVVGSR